MTSATISGRRAAGAWPHSRGTGEYLWRESDARMITGRGGMLPAKCSLFSRANWAEDLYELAAIWQ
jgi:hypothetical protein